MPLTKPQLHRETQYLFQLDKFFAHLEQGRPKLAVYVGRQIDRLELSIGRMRARELWDEYLFACDLKPDIETVALDFWEGFHEGYTELETERLIPS